MEEISSLNWMEESPAERQSIPGDHDSAASVDRYDQWSFGQIKKRTFHISSFSIKYGDFGSNVVILGEM